MTSHENRLVERYFQIKSTLYTSAIGCLLIAFGLVNHAQASTALVTSNAALGATDSVDWGTLGPEGTLLSPYVFSATSTGGLTVFGSTLAANPNSFEILTQGSHLWTGNFAAGDNLLYTNGSPGPITFSFLNPVSGVGTQIETSAIGGFIAQISAFDSNGNPLQTQTYDYQEAGASTHGGNPAIFLGISSTLTDISKVEITVLPLTGVSVTDFAINQLDIAAPPVPEPTSYAMLLAGLGLVGFVVRKNKQVRV